MTDIVKLDVGGTVFKTTISTLTKFDGFFKTMFKTPDPITRDESGAIFIDRDPTHFQLILNFMRDGHVDLQKYSEDVKEIQKEAEYYLLKGLSELCSRILEPSEIKLDVGGRIFYTSFEMLKKIPKFTKITNVAEVPKDESGAIFIDRDPTHFEKILEFVRDGHVALPEVRVDVKEIQQEAQYYLLWGLVDLCRKKAMRPIFH